jgi:hypothetical protein
MRAILLALGIFIVVTGAARAQEVVPPVAGIEATINQQIEAFRADDFAQAFTFASPSIRNLFRTPENFGAMVRNGYPMVWRPRSVTFGDLRDVAGGLWQRVIVTDSAGGVHALDYLMVQVDGAWRIAGVQLLPAPDLSA